MIVLGVNHSHNACVTLAVDEEIVLHIESERINNIRYGYLPFPAIAEIKNYVSYIDHLVISGTHPVVDRINDLYIMDAYSAFVKSLGRSFENHHFVTTDFSREHHLTHAISAYYGSGFDTALCIVKDGGGSIIDTKFGQVAERQTSIIIDRENFYLVERKLSSNHAGENIALSEKEFIIAGDSEANGFSAIAQNIGFGFWDAGKVMGLSSYGKESAYSFIRDDGLDRAAAHNAKWESFQDTADMAYAIQKETEDYTISHILKMVEETGITDVTLSGGLFQNCVMNYKILRALPQGARLYVEPLSNDAGTSVGAVDWIHRKHNPEYKNKRSSLYLGTHPKYTEIPNSESIDAKGVAGLIADKKIVAVFQGRSEAGTRALGNRSILYDPRDPNGKDRVNTVKKREWFRPFAASVLHSHANEWFDMERLEESPYMLYAINVREGMGERIPCVVHVNNTCRIQTVKEEQNKNFYDLIREFHLLTGVPMVLNTSFNLAGDAIVETLDQALDTLYNSEIDALYLPDIGVIVNKRSIG